jgi:hypothetical protein
MPFERHAFISYAHIDNQPLPTEKEGWVTLFHEALEQLLAGRLGGQADIWRDDKLRGNDVFSDEIVAQFPRTAALVSILTPRYVKSEWCTKELGRFCEAAGRTGGLVVDNKCRIFKVVKLPVEAREALPQVLGEVLGYEFYEIDADHAPRELDPAYGEKSKQDFLRRVARLAWDIKLLLDRLAAHDGAAGGARKDEGAARPVIFLAECSRDRREAREVLEAELERLGYTVLPDRPLPGDEGEYVAAVAALLARSQLAVHLVGSGYGMVPDGPSQKSVVAIQNELAVTRAREAMLPRIVWLPEGTTSAHPAQAAFIEALHTRPEIQFGADLITGDLETLRGAVHAALKKLERSRSAAASAAAGGTRKRVHLLCDARDRKDALPLIRRLRDTVDVTLPIFTGDAAAVREANQSLLAACDAAILYYGAGDEAWKFHQQNELRRIRALRGDRPLPPEVLYLAAPVTEDKELLVGLGEPHLIDALTGVPEAVIATFLAGVTGNAST